MKRRVNDVALDKFLLLEKDERRFGDSENAGQCAG